MNLRRGLDCVVLGVLWGLLAFLLGRRAFGPAIWPGLFASPLIGLAVGLALQERFESARPGVRRVISLLSLYLGATIFGMVIGLGTWLGLSPGSRRFPAAVVESVLGVWWGVTITGFVLALWPLAHLSHWWIAHRSDRA